MTYSINISNLDTIYLTYDEPQKEEFWIKIQNMVPWVKRVDGVKGSDTAHKAAAAASETDRFILIDGDNLPDPEFFDLVLTLDDTNKDCVFRWRARNIVNGLVYGNGGISCWTRDFVMNMKTHENTDGRDETRTEFCFDPKYIAMHNCYSTTYINYSPFQAWRAGFREGVKMCLHRGSKPALSNFEESLIKSNLDNLSIWHSIGMDVPNGSWAIYGARMGTYMTMLTEWDYTSVHSFDVLKQIWQEYAEGKDSIVEGIELGRILKNRLGLFVADMNSEQSKFFKHFYSKQHINASPMTTSMNAIRSAEWYERFNL